MGGEKSGRSVGDAWEEPSDEPGSTLDDWDDRAPDQRDDRGEPMPIATVNGRPITRKRMMGLLVRTHGLSVLEQLIALELIRQTAEIGGVSITPADISAEHDRAVSRISSPVPTSTQPTLAKEAREALLVRILARRGLSREEFDLAMERQAYLRKIASKRLKIADDQLREQFEIMYDERVQVRHIQLSNLREAGTVQRLLAAGGDFVEIARVRSKNATTGPNGGLLPPFSRNQGDVPPQLRDVAFKLEPGQVSNPVRIESDYHLVKSIKRFTKSKIQFEHVKEIVRVKLVERVLPEMMDQIERDLFGQSKARIVITDPALRKRFQDKHKLGRSGAARGK